MIAPGLRWRWALFSYRKTVAATGPTGRHERTKGCNQCFDQQNDPPQRQNPMCDATPWLLCHCTVSLIAFNSAIKLNKYQLNVHQGKTPRQGAKKTVQL